MLGNLSSPATFYVPDASRISSILCPSESNIEGQLVQDYVYTSINSHKLSETRSSLKEIVYVLTILVGYFFQRTWISHQLSLHWVTHSLVH